MLWVAFCSKKLRRLAVESIMYNIVPSHDKFTGQRCVPQSPERAALQSVSPASVSGAPFMLRFEISPDIRLKDARRFPHSPATESTAT